MAQEPDYSFQGPVPDGPDTFFFLEFEVPEGIEEIEVRHTHIPEQTGNVLDWGLDDPNGSRGWGGSNSEDTIVSVQAATRNYIPGEIPAGTWQVTVGKARLVEGEPAGYLVEVFLRESATLEPQPRAPYQDPGVLADGPRWYAGDFHVHTRESGDVRASLTIDEALDFAEGQGLDFVMLSEHNTNSGFTLYADAQARHPNLLIFPGQEFTTYRGHANALGALDNVQYTVGTDGYTIEDAIAAFQAQGALFSINHPSIPLPDCRGCAWEFDVDPTLVDASEVQTAILRGFIFYEDLVANGSHATAIAGSDDHRAGQNLGPVDRPIGTPTTLVYADELSVEAILEGVRSGRTMVKVNGPGGPDLETTLSGERDGFTVFADEAVLRADVAGAQGLTLRVVKNGETLETVAIDSDPFTYETLVEAPEDGEDRYRHEVLEGPNPQTLTSYVWLRKGTNGTMPDAGVPDGGGGSGEPGDSGGCTAYGPGATEGRSTLAWGLFFLCGWWLLRRRSPSGI